MVAGIATQRVLIRAQTGTRTGLNTILQDAANAARGILVTSATRADNTIPIQQLGTVQRLVGDIIQRVFVGSDLRHPYASDGRTALAPYPQLLNQWIAWETAQVVIAQRNQMRRALPANLERWLVTGRRTVTELVADPFANYQSAWDWIDPNGHSLSDRIWRTSFATRQKIDALIADGIRNGESAVVIARRLEQFLLPNRAPLRTLKPYGTDGSYDAVRLARTEITRAFGQAVIMSAQQNPFVTGIRWNLSPSHPRADVCDPLAADSPYPVDKVPTYPPHPQCLCNLSPEVTDDIRGVLEQLQQMMDSGQDAPLTPLDYRAFLVALLGSFLADWILRQEQAA